MQEARQHLARMAGRDAPPLSPLPAKAHPGGAPNSQHASQPPRAVLPPAADAALPPPPPGDKENTPPHAKRPKPARQSLQGPSLVAKTLNLAPAAAAAAPLTAPAAPANRSGPGSLASSGAPLFRDGLKYSLGCGWLKWLSSLES